MQINVKPMGMLRDHAPADGILELPAEATIAHVMARLDIPADAVQVFSVNGSIERDENRQLADGDELTLLPPVGGG